MAMLAAGILKILNKRLPKVISPRAHAVIDYATAGAFFMMAAMLWKRNRRAAFGALMSGAGEAATAAFTSFPGGLVDAISFETHGKVDAALSGLVATLPNMLDFEDDKAAAFFRTQAILMGGVTAMTDFGGDIADEESSADREEADVGEGDWEGSRGRWRRAS